MIKQVVDRCSLSLQPVGLRLFTTRDVPVVHLMVRLSTIWHFYPVRPVGIRASIIGFERPKPVVSITDQRLSALVGNFC